MKTAQEKQQETFDALKGDFEYENPMEAPHLEKIVISTGIGSITDKTKIDLIPDRLAQITGQQPKPTQAKKSIASFKSRQGDVIGYQVTLRGERMRSFFDKLIHIVFPRTKDFRGIDRNTIDEMGNITIGISEHTAFPEASDEELRNVFGLAVTIVISAPNREVAEAYLEHLGIPFKKKEE
ncbi:MAG: 50S ribosomal protein L5 [Candidatus Paceibacterota bacterium]